MNTCSTCSFARLFPEDMMKRICRGGPPQLIVVPTPKGVGIQSMFPVVNATDEACGSYKKVLMLVTEPTQGQP